MYKFTFRQQVVFGFSLTLLFVIIAAYTALTSIQTMKDDADWENHTYEVIDQAQKAENTLLQAENNLRGYILAKSDLYLDAYKSNLDEMLPVIRALKEKTIDNPVQQIRIDSLERFATQKSRNMQEILQVNASKGLNAASIEMLIKRGSQYSENMLKVNNDFIADENKLLQVRKDNRINSGTQSTVILIGSALGIIGLVIYLSSFIKRTFDEQKITELRIRESNEQLAKVSAENEQKNWMLSGASKINESLSGEQYLDDLCSGVITALCNYVNASLGAIYLFNTRSKKLELRGTYAFDFKIGKNEISLSEGIIGQVAVEKQMKVLQDLPEGYVKVGSALGDAKPIALIVMPVLFENQLMAVIELGINFIPTPYQIDFFNHITEDIGIAINRTLSKEKLNDLLLQTQQQAEELESQQEELRTTNEELIHKSEELQSSEEELRVQQEELRETNAELEARNIAVNEAREAMTLKAEELEISSRYKSEFLANMSHELRTPLNSILILARILKENRGQNMNEEQLKYAGVIHNSGSDLLSLINDILDLSKIESGKVELDIEAVGLEHIKRNMESLFTEVAKSKKIDFSTVLHAGIPEKMMTDLSKTEQIIKNLLSNAFKFTPESGTIQLEIGIAGKEVVYHAEHLKNYTEDIFYFSVIDSGIGIPEDKQKLIFEAFKQADGTTSRKYGGTGLGLSISKELAHILGGEIQVKSVSGEGSCFTLYLPLTKVDENLTPEIIAPVVFSPAPNYQVPLNKNKKQRLLIVEDDLVFADVLKDYAAEKGFDPMLAHRGDTGLQTAIDELPDAIILDIMLPEMDGWNVLKRLKANPKTKHIPVHMMSAGEVKGEHALKQGAIGFLKKPMGKEEIDTAFTMLSTVNNGIDFQSVLVIEDHELQSMIATEQLTERGIAVEQAFTGKEALELLDTHNFDCIILDLNLPDITGFDLLDKIKAQDKFAHTPVIINTAMELDQDKIAHIMKYSEAIVLKSHKSNDRLIDEVSLFMNKLKKQDNFQSSTSALKTSNTISTIEKVLKDKTIMITDDDMRNIFALSSALQVYDINIIIANNGREALELVNGPDKIDLILMDIMMPEMDGYEAMRQIRAQKSHQKLPIIALTAKAMKNDREKCIEAGANDYIPKPVDMDKLLSLLRVWLS